MGILLGAIGDDFTGSTDLALTLCKRGMPTVQYIGVPSDSNAAVNTPAAVVALKSRTTPVNEAVAQSLAACQWLLEQGARQIFFKYCSTFDSTLEGNIGPVAEALLNFLDGKRWSRPCVFQRFISVRKSSPGCRGLSASSRTPSAWRSSPATLAAKIFLKNPSKCSLERALMANVPP